jgi:queuine tRNA-ribosyltransferase
MRVNEMLGAILLSTINLAYYQELMAGARSAIEQGQYVPYCDAIREGWSKGDLSPI